MPSGKDSSKIVFQSLTRRVQIRHYNYCGLRDQTVCTVIEGARSHCSVNHDVVTLIRIAIDY